jgi:N-acetylglutamate synthase-like GNAT family acetyltransferase
VSRRRDAEVTVIEGIRRAAPSDFERIEALLRNAHLPVDGAREAFAMGFVAEERDTIVGAVALEVYPDTALLRSLVVDRAVQGKVSASV